MLITQERLVDIIVLEIPVEFEILVHSDSDSRATIKTFKSVLQIIMSSTRNGLQSLRARRGRTSDGKARTDKR